MVTCLVYIFVEKEEGGLIIGFVETNEFVDDFANLFNHFID